MPARAPLDAPVPLWAKAVLLGCAALAKKDGTLNIPPKKLAEQMGLSFRRTACAVSYLVKREYLRYDGKLITGMNGVEHHAARAVERDIVWNEKAKRLEGIGQQDMERWQKAYPAIPVPLCIRQAEVWVDANPANRKSNYRRFLINWLSREQNRAGRQPRSER